MARASLQLTIASAFTGGKQYGAIISTRGGEALMFGDPRALARPDQHGEEVVPGPAHDVGMMRVERARALPHDAAASPTSWRMRGMSACPPQACSFPTR